MSAAMLREELTAALSEFEAKSDAATWICHGFHVWPVIRNHLALALHQQGAAAIPSPGTRLRNAVTRRRDRIAGTVAAWKSDPRAKADVVFISRTNRGQRFGGRMHNTVVDPWVEEAERQGAVPRVWNLGRPQGPAHEAHVNIQHAVDEAIRRVQSAGPAPAWFAALSEFIATKLDADIAWLQIGSEIARVAAIAETFETWLRLTAPCAVVLDCWYDREKLAAILAAHRLGIETIDLQHGIQGRGHPAYAGWTSNANVCAEVMPQKYWVWGDFDAESLVQQNPAIIAPDQVRVVGNRWLSLWNGAADARFVEPLREAAALAGSHRSVLVTLQTGVPFRETLLPLIEAAPDNWRWLVRMHRGMTDAPATLEQSLRSQAGSNVEVVGSTRLPLYALLRTCSAHLTGFSTCALEALSFGVPSVLTHESGHHAFTEFLDAGVMHRFNTVEHALGKLSDDEPGLAERCRAASRSVFAEASGGGPWCT